MDDKIINDYKNRPDTRTCCEKCFQSKADGGACDMTCPCHQSHSVGGDWVRTFLDEGKEIMGMDCSGLIGIVSRAVASAEARGANNWIRDNRPITHFTCDGHDDPIPTCLQCSLEDCKSAEARGRAKKGENWRKAYMQGAAEEREGMVAKRGEIEKILWKHYDPDLAPNMEEITDEIVGVLSHLTPPTDTL